jgi:hypothetical protein
MQSNPLVEWQRLTQLYREKNDDELLDLAADSADLTEVAQQVLRDEMKTRGLDKQNLAASEPIEPDRPVAPQYAPDFNLPDTNDPGAEDAQGQSDLSREYTWKTLLCECDGWEEAWQIRELLRRGGIESWIERPGSRHAIPWDELGVGNLHVLVAADQLDQSRAIAAQPVPQDIIDESKEKTPDFVPPVCPHCGAADPVLEGVDPCNTWRCEACGKRWTESIAEQSGNPEQAGQEAR